MSEGLSPAICSCAPATDFRLPTTRWLFSHFGWPTLVLAKAQAFSIMAPTRCNGLPEKVREVAFLQIFKGF